jgi:effector-binding domain-containing protein
MTVPDAVEPEVVEFGGATTAVIRAVVPMTGIASFFDTSFSSLATAIAEQAVAVTGPAFALYHGPPTDVADLEVGFTTDRAVEAAGDVAAGTLPPGRVARLVHLGGYDTLGSSWQRLGAWMGERRLTPGPLQWEVYVTEPSPEMDPADLRSELNWLLSD